MSVSILSVYVYQPRSMIEIGPKMIEYATKIRSGETPILDQWLRMAKPNGELGFTHTRSIRATAPKFPIESASEVVVLSLEMQLATRDFKSRRGYARGERGSPYHLYWPPSASERGFQE